jgi:SAM-dependent methyltransferase
MPEVYSAAFYDTMQRDAVGSAHVIVPRIVELVRPNSVIDVGCGTGGWLSVFQELGVDDILGVDGTWVDRSRLLVAPDRFLATDLTERLEVHRQFDLAVSLEVAEHLPSSSADQFVVGLTELADTVLFSAAAPGQGGTDHVNEQWPSYWVKRFADQEFLALDCVRWEHWQDPRVAAFYVQNAFLTVRQTATSKKPDLVAWMERHPDRVGDIPAVVHPSTRVARFNSLEDHFSLRELARAIAGRTQRVVRARIDPSRARRRHDAASEPHTEHQ